MAKKKLPTGAEAYELLKSLPDEELVAFVDLLISDRRNGLKGPSVRERVASGECISPEEILAACWREWVQPLIEMHHDNAELFFEFRAGYLPFKASRRKRVPKTLAMVRFIDEAMSKGKTKEQAAAIVKKRPEWKETSASSIVRSYDRQKAKAKDR